MNVIYIHGLGESYPDFTIEGSILTLEDELYDLLALQKDEQAIINIMKEDRFIANIIIPPAVYEEIESDEVDDEDNPIYKRIRKPLEIESVDLNLWKLELKTIKESEEL